MNPKSAPCPGCPPEALAQVLAVPVRTARRWKSRNSMPRAYALLFAALVAGELGALWPDWSGWRLVDGRLVSPEGAAFTAAEVRALPLQLQLIAALERDRAPGSQVSLF